MKAYLIELVVVDHDNVGAEGIRSAIEDTKYPNRCILPTVIRTTQSDIGQWSDNHPMNRVNADWSRYF